MNDSNRNTTFWAIVPAAGIGSRVGAAKPKQYIKINDRTVIEHTFDKLSGCKIFEKIIVALSADDEYFINLSTVGSHSIHIVEGGAERSDSVLSALKYLKTIAHDNDWVLVHDAARPCVPITDIKHLINSLKNHSVGGILGLPVRDTMKRATNIKMSHTIQSTVSRDNLWHALTPQMFRVGMLYDALVECKEKLLFITDEASAIEHVGFQPVIIEGSTCNMKITQPDDLQLASLYLSQQEIT